MKKRILFLFGMGVLFLVLCFKFFDLSGTLAHYQKVNYWYLPLFTCQADPLFQLKTRQKPSRWRPNSGIAQTSYKSP